jgi:AraC-like DNA-binding protein
MGLMRRRSSRPTWGKCFNIEDTMADLVPIPLDLFDRLRRAGLDVDAILRRAKLPRSRFSVPRPQGTTAEFFALWRAVEEESDDPGLGLRIGVEVLPDEENVVSLAAMHSATLGEGLHKLARYKRLVCPEQVSIDVGGGEARLRFEWLLADGAPPRLLTDIIFAGVTNLAQRGTKTPVRPRRLEFIRRRANEAMLRRHFRCELRFDAPHDQLFFDEEALALPMVQRNAQLLAVLLSGLEQSIEQDEQARTLADDVRTALSETMSGDRPAIAKVAKCLGMSPRTMQRRLGELGTTYQDVLDGVRRRSARQLLASTDLGVGEVAFLLGFEEVNSFTRAFHAWEGTTPAKWRAGATLRRGEAQRERRSGKVRGARLEPIRAHLTD